MRSQGPSADLHRQLNAVARSSQECRHGCIMLQIAQAPDLQVLPPPGQSTAGLLPQCIVIKLPPSSVVRRSPEVYQTERGEMHLRGYCTVHYVLESFRRLTELPCPSPRLSLASAMTRSSNMTQPCRPLPNANAYFPCIQCYRITFLFHLLLASAYPMGVHGVCGVPGKLDAS